MKLFRPVAVRLGAQPWLPRFAKVIVGSDLLLQRLTRGRIGVMDFAGLPELLLQVPGRKSGILRSTPLLTVPHGGGWLVVGSNWGRPEPPAWVGNLLAADDPMVTVKGRTMAVDAKLLTGPERDELWAVATATWPNYDKYAERTDRELPIFWLTPR